MHHSTKRRVVLGMTTGGLLLTGIGMGVAQADATADGGASNSPGLLSGNLIQVPIDAPINVCGNGVDVVGVLDSVFDNHCGNADSGSGGAGANGSSANGGAHGSPGIGSGNLIQIPITAPINVCGNSVSGVGVGDKAVGNSCENGGSQGANGASANGGSEGSPGIGSGNTVQVPITTPVNVCGNQVSVIGLGDTAAGNTCENGGPALLPPPPPPNHSGPQPCSCQQPTTPPATPTTPWTPGSPTSPTGPSTTTVGSPTGSTSGYGHSHQGSGGGFTGTLAETGTGASNVVAPLGAGVLGGGGLLLRKRFGALHRLTHRQH